MRRGYTGAELLRLCAQHPEFEVVYATGDTQAGTLASGAVPQPRGRAIPNLVFERVRRRPRPRARRRLPRVAARGIDGAGARSLHGQVGCLVDLSAAFRLKDASLYPTWYGFEHDQPELLAAAVFGLPELHRDGSARSAR